MAQDFSAEELAEIKAQFAKFDLNGDNTLDAKEVRELLVLIGEKDAPGFRVRELIEEVDTNKNGTIEFNEFLYILKQVRSGKDTGFGKVVEKAGGLNLIKGTSEKSADGTVHSHSDEEKVAFADWINYVLANDTDLKKVLPINDKDDSLFTSCTDGILLCKLINDAVPETIDERAINKKAKHPVEIAENITLMLNSAKAIGCNVVNIGPSDIQAGTHHLILGLIWQIVKIGLFARINLANVPGLARLLEDGETLEDLMALPIEQILLRWMNYHLKAAGHPRRVNNFGKDIKDSECYTILINQIAPKDAGVNLSPLSEGDEKQRAEKMLQQADKINCRKFVRPTDVVKGNQKLNLAFVANMFNTCPALEAVEIEVIEETREEKTYRNWMNSLGVSPFVNSLYQDLRDGLVLIQLFDKIQPGIVNWERVNQPPWKAMGGNMKKIENDNYALELGKQMQFSLVGIGGKDLFDGNKTLTLAVVWQMMRAYTLSILTQLGGGAKIADNEIIEWTNKTLKSAGKSSSIRSFKDPSISSAIPVLDLVDAVQPGSINYSNVIANPSGDGDKMKNAKYAVSMGRKIGAVIFALPEDLVEVKDKMCLTVFAAIMAVALSKK